MSFIFCDMNFGKVSETNVRHSALEEFVTNYVLKHDNSGWLLQNLSDLYLVRALECSENYLNEGEKKWSDVLTTDQYDLLQANREYVVAVMLVKKVSSNLHRIEYIDTRVPNQKFADHLMCLYKDVIQNDCLLFPGEIIESAKFYWKRYFEDNLIESKEELDEFIDDNNLHEFIDWKELIDLF